MNTSYSKKNPKPPPASYYFHYGPKSCNCFCLPSKCHGARESNPYSKDLTCGLSAGCSPRTRFGGRKSCFHPDLLTSCLVYNYSVHCISFQMQTCLCPSACKTTEHGETVWPSLDAQWSFC